VSNLGVWFLVIPILAFIAMLIGTYSLGRGKGLMGVGAAFLGCLALLKFPILGIILLLVGVGIGNLAMD